VIELNPRVDVRFDPESDRDRATSNMSRWGNNGLMRGSIIKLFDYLVGEREH
jgi:hypothetical protein